MRLPVFGFLIVVLASAGASLQAQSPAPLASTQIDDAFSEVTRLAAEKFKVAKALADAVETEKKLQQEAQAITGDGASYQQALAAHDASCKDRDWRLPAFQQCPGSKARLDTWQATSLAHVTDFQKRKAANQAQLAGFRARLSEIDTRLGAIDDQLRNTAPFLAARQCRDTDVLKHLACLQDVWANTDGLIRLQLDNIAFRYSYPDTAPASTPFRRRTESLLVGGTGWVYGYYVPTDRPDLAGEQEKNLQRQLSLAGVAPEKFVNRADYDMIIAVAQSQDQFVDLLDRVVLGLANDQLPGDQLTLGQFSAANQNLYASLKGTQTTKLDCHSNGAMVCLAALWNGDVAAESVRLFGPQLTPAALARWESMLRGGKIKSLEINMTKGDPIAPASYAFGRSPKLYAAVEIAKLVMARGSIPKLDAFAPDAADKLRAEIQQYAPNINVRVFDDASCRQRISSENFACHDMTLYQRLATGTR